MSKIHHNTLTRAKAHRATLKVLSETEYMAHMGTEDKPLHAHTASKAASALNGCLMRKRLKQELPMVEMYGQDHLSFVVTDIEDEDHQLATLEASAIKEEVLLTALKKRLEGLSVEIPRPTTNRMSINKKYKEKYADKGDQSHCGDWLAKFLKGRFDNPETKTFDHTKFTEFLVENGVDMSGKWAKLPDSGQNGWQGRYRMNGRQKLELKIAARGWIKLDGETTTLPEDEWLALSDKHPKVDVEDGSAESF